MFGDLTGLAQALARAASEVACVQVRRKRAASALKSADRRSADDAPPVRSGLSEMSQLRERLDRLAQTMPASVPETE